METSSFPDILGVFEVAELAEGQLDDTSSVQSSIVEKQVRNTYWRLGFKRVQYGTFHGESVCLLVVEGKVHAEEAKRHRFTWMRISVEFKGEQIPVEVLNLAPERAHGLHVPEERMSHWAISSDVSLSMPGIPVTVDLFSVKLGHSKKYSIERIAGMQGSKRGFPDANEAVWTLEEAREEGLPWKIPSMIVLLKIPPNAEFFANFNVQAKVNASFNPLSWVSLKASAKSVRFDGKAELIPAGEELDRDFTLLDISKLTKLDFAEDR